MPIHHPDDSLLIEYAAGSVSEARALLVATHVALCPACRAAVRDGEVVGGVLLRDSAYRVGVGDPREPTALVAAPPTPTAASPMSPFPSPLREYVRQPLAGLAWTPVWRGMSEYPLPQFANGVRLLSIPGGRRMPRHTHDGEELTLVLQGSFADATGHYAKGDVATADASIDHQPRAGAGEMCLCLAVEDGALRLTGWAGRLLTAASTVRELARRR
jgi:putative transcriptional regulator